MNRWTDRFDASPHRLSPRHHRGARHSRRPLGARSVADLGAGGVSAADARATATWCAAQSCGLGKHKGRLRAGYDADLLLVDGNPLDDIGALRRVSAVILNGAIAGKSADIEEGPA